MSVYVGVRIFALRVMSLLSILTYNFAGGYPFAERRGSWMADYVEKNKPEVCCFQEVSAPIFAILQSRFGKIYKFHDGGGGMLILTSEEAHPEREDGTGRAREHAMQVRLEGGPRIVNLFLPSGDDKEAIRADIAAEIVSLGREGQPTFLAGFFAIGRDDEHLVPEKLENMLFESEWNDLWDTVGCPYVCRYTFDPLDSSFWASKIPVACRPTRILVNQTSRIDRYTVVIPEMSFHRAILASIVKK